MYYNPLTKEEEFHELVKEIESQSAYKRVPFSGEKIHVGSGDGTALGFEEDGPILAGSQEFFQDRSDPGENACGAGKLREMVCQSDQISQGYRGRSLDWN